MSNLRRPFVTQRVRPVKVRVNHGVIIRRHGRSYLGGRVLEVDPFDAERLERSGAAERVDDG